MADKAGSGKGEEEAKTDEAKTDEAETRSSPVSEGGHHLESVGISECESKNQSLEGGNNVESVKDTRKTRLDRLRELHLRRVRQRKM